MVLNENLQNFKKMVFHIHSNSVMKSLKCPKSNEPLSHSIIPNLSEYTLDNQMARQSFRQPIVPLYCIEDCRIS